MICKSIPQYQVLIFLSKPHAEMKYITTSLLCLCLAASLFVSCKKNDSKEKPEPVKNPPGVTDFTATGTFNDTVTITGTNFSTKIESIEVKFGEAKAEVISTTTGKILVRVPENIKSAKSKITVTVEGVAVASNSEFTLKKPKIMKSPEFAKLDSIIVLEVKNFHPNAALNKLSIDGKEISNAEFLPGLVKFKIPKGYYPENIATLKFTMLDYETEQKIPVKRDMWKLLAASFPIVPKNDFVTKYSFVINNNAYVISSGLIKSATRVWKFNTDFYDWVKVGDSTFNLYEGAGVVNTSTHAYLFTLNKLIRYNPATNEWTPLKNAPTSIINPAMFVVGNSLFIGLGNGDPSDSRNSDFYRYDISSDNWTKISPYPVRNSDTQYHNPIAFVINDLAYVGNGSYKEIQENFFSYNAVSDKWNKVQDYPITTTSGNSFSWAGKGYSLGGFTYYDKEKKENSKLIYQYNPLDNKWTKHSILEEDDLTPVDSFFSFIVDGKVYVGTRQNKIYVANLEDL